MRWGQAVVTLLGSVGDLVGSLADLIRSTALEKTASAKEKEANAQQTALESTIDQVMWENTYLRDKMLEKEIRHKQRILQLGEVEDKLKKVNYNGSPPSYYFAADLTQLTYLVQKRLKDNNIRIPLSLGGAEEE